jgi:hypothetical protein
MKSKLYRVEDNESNRGGGQDSGLSARNPKTYRICRWVVASMKEFISKATKVNGGCKSETRYGNWIFRRCGNFMFNRKNGNYPCSGVFGLDLQRAAELSQSFPHTTKSDAGL